MAEFPIQAMEAWDPLESRSDPDMVVAAQRREIRNILKSYTGYYDLFAELLQNALDALERRQEEQPEIDFDPSIWVTINMRDATVAVTDNGCGMDEEQFRQFLRPNFSFKQGETTRGSKGVGATYLAYGFNHLEVATKVDGRTYSGVIRRGREWAEDRSESVLRPKVESLEPQHPPFLKIDRGSSMLVKLVGSAIRPRDLTWVGADEAGKWLAVLRTTTPLGGVYLCGDQPHRAKVFIEVIDSEGQSTSASVAEPGYLYPEKVLNRVADLRDFLADQKKRVDKGQDVSKVPAKFKSLNGIWGEWTGQEILDPKSDCPITVRLEENEQELVIELGIKLKIFLAFSTDLWDSFNDKQLGLRKSHRLLRGGLQLCTRHMPQGLPLTIPMTNNIGFQNLAHVLIHMENAEPDLGRKGFQPDQVRVAEKLSVSAVTAFRKRYNLLRKPGGAKEYDDELKLDQWKQEQIKHESDFPLVVRGKGLFLPSEELPIRSEPIVEQDVVSLFNQMLSSGVVRGIQLISSSQYKQYDGLFRIKMEPPFYKFVLSESNPLGIDEEHFLHKDQLETVIKVLEYKYSVDGLIEEFQGEVKAIEDVDLIVAWDMGEKWGQMFEVTSYLDTDNVHLRKMHGATHSFTHAMTGATAFEAIVLEDLVNYLNDADPEEARQKEKYMEI